MGPKEDQDRFDAGLQREIAEKGWAVYCSRADGLPYSYTIGLTGVGLAELVIVGLAPEISMDILNAVAQRCVDAPPVDGEKFTTDALGPQLTYKVWPVSPVWPSQHMAKVRRFYPDWYSGNVLQVLWPDKVGTFPGELGCTLNAFAQPLLADLG